METTTPRTNETININNDNAQNSIKDNNKKKTCHWNEDSIKLLLSFLIERKEEVNQLSTK